MTTSLSAILDRTFPNRFGRYERDNTRLLKTLVRRGATVWDIGANVGQMTVVLSRLVGPEGHVVSVEPSPQNAHTLKQHARHNVRVVEYAVSDTAGVAHFAGDGRSDAMIRDDGGITVQTTTLDDMLGQYPSPSLVKLDIEGHEFPAFRGGLRLLSEVRPILVVEFHGKGLPERDIDSEARQLVHSLGYRWERPHPEGWHVARPH
jgi:FkbM family methyltransferase